MATPQQIPSQNEMFRGQMVNKPPKALIAGTAVDGGDLWHCPHCSQVIDEEDCDVMGAEPECLFCNHCNGEFEIP